MMKELSKLNKATRAGSPAGVASRQECRSYAQRWSGVETRLIASLHETGHFINQNLLYLVARGNGFARSMRVKALFLLAFVFCCSLAFGQTYDPSVPPDIASDFQLLSKKIQKNPNDVAVLNALGIVYARVGQLNEAIAVWQRGLRIDPDYIHLYNNLASGLKSLRKYDQAREIYLRALKLGNSYWIYFNLGLLEREVNNLQHAKKYFQIVLQLFPNFQPAEEQIHQIERITGETSISKLPLPPVNEYKRPIDFSEIDAWPPLWEQKNNNSETRNFFRTGVARNNPVPQTPLTLKDCMEIISAIPAEKVDKVVALTFDDGPHAELTPRLLDFLSGERICATFFMIGSRAEAYPDIVSRMVREGHETGNHTWRHNSLVKQGKTNALNSLKQTELLLTQLSGKPCTLVRPPFGHTSAEVFELIRSQGWEQVMWDVDSRDWKDGTTDSIISRVIRQIGPGSIVLFHDNHTGALRTLPTLVTALKNCGYRFVPVSQILKKDPHAS